MCSLGAHPKPSLPQGSFCPRLCTTVPRIILPDYTSCFPQDTTRVALLKATLIMAQQRLQEMQLAWHNPLQKTNAALLLHLLCIMLSLRNAVQSPAEGMGQAGHGLPRPIGALWQWAD